MSHKLASALLAALFLAISSLSGAQAEARAPATKGAATLSPDEARRALETLQKLTPVQLAPINFEALYQQQLAQASSEAPAVTN